MLPPVPQGQVTTDINNKLYLKQKNKKQEIVYAEVLFLHEQAFQVTGAKLQVAGEGVCLPAPLGAGTGHPPGLRTPWAGLPGGQFPVLQGVSIPGCSESPQRQWT